MALAPINLSEAAQDLATGDFGDLDAAEIFLEYAPIQAPPYLVAGLGLAIGVLEALTFQFGLGRLGEMTVWLAMLIVLLYVPSSGILCLLFWLLVQNVLSYGL